MKAKYVVTSWVVWFIMVAVNIAEGYKLPTIVSVFITLNFVVSLVVFWWEVVKDD